MSLSRRAHAALPVVISGLVLAIAQLHGHLELVLPIVPLLLLLVSLLAGIYPGCNAIVRLAERIGLRPRRAATSEEPPPARPTHAAQGGLLLAFSLSGRAPPA